MDISILIATYQRREILLRALALYGKQRTLGGTFEAVVVDDASTDGTVAAVERFARSAGYPIRVERLGRNSGPAAARNRALDLARGRILLFVGDDILPEPGFLAAHRRWHDEIHPEPHEAMVGRIRWASEMRQTPFLTWLEMKGAQFAYGSMKHGAVIDYGRFYTSNASVKRAFLEQTGIRFDEQIPFGRVVGWEDSEFALGLAKAGMVLRHDATAVAEHLHPTNLESSLRRIEVLGAGLVTLRETSPDNFRRITGGLFEPNARRRRVVARVLLSAPLAATVWTPLARLFEKRIIVDRIFALAHSAALLRGFRRAGGTLMVDARAGALARAGASLDELRAGRPQLSIYNLLARLAAWRICRTVGLRPTVRVHERSLMQLEALKGDHGIQTAIYLLRDSYEPSVREAIDRVLRPGDAAIDIGSNLGLWTLRMAERVGPDGRVIAVEPMPETLRRLRANLSRSGARHVVTLGCALGDEEGSAALHVPLDLGLASLSPLGGTAASVQVPVRRLDDVWRELGRPQVRLVKIDVEGAEPAVLQGGREFFGTARPVVCCEVNPPRLAAFGHDADAITGFFAELGYRLHCWDAGAGGFVPAAIGPGDDVLDALFILPEHGFSAVAEAIRGGAAPDHAPAEMVEFAAVRSKAI